MKTMPNRRFAALRHQKGITLMEMVLVVAVIGLVWGAVAELGFPIVKFFQHSRARQEANLEMRICVETIARVLSNGKAATLVISTPPTTPTVQFSSATFQSLDGSYYTITWSASPLNTVHLQKTPLGGVTSDTLLATHVTNLTFGIDDKDPGIVNVILGMTVPLDSSGGPASFLTILLPKQTIRMIGS